MDVHLRDLRCFVAIAEHLHFTRAAEVLYVSQPTLSKQLRALEGQLRVQLLPDDERYAHIEVRTEPRLIALPTGHRLAGRTRPGHHRRIRRAVPRPPRRSGAAARLPEQNPVVHHEPRQA